MARRSNGGLTAVAALRHLSQLEAVPARTLSRHTAAAITAISDAHHRRLQMAR